MHVISAVAPVLAFSVAATAISSSTVDHAAQSTSHDSVCEAKSEQALISQGHDPLAVSVVIRTTLIPPMVTVTSIKTVKSQMTSDNHVSSYQSDAAQLIVRRLLIQR